MNKRLRLHSDEPPFYMATQSQLEAYTPENQTHNFFIQKFAKSVIQKKNLIPKI